MIEKFLNSRWFKLIAVIVGGISIYFLLYFKDPENIRFDFSFRRVFLQTTEESFVLEDFLDTFGQDISYAGIIFDSHKNNGVFLPHILQLNCEAYDLLSEDKNIDRNGILSIVTATDLYGNPIKANVFLPLCPLLKRFDSLSSKQKKILLKKIEVIKTDLKKHSVYKNFLFSRDYSKVFFIAPFKSYVKEDSEVSKTVEKVLRFTRKHKGVAYPVGVPVVQHEYKRIVQKDLKENTTIAVLIIVILQIIVFRSLILTILPLFLVLVAIGVTGSIMLKSGEPINMINHIFPVVTLVIGFSDVIHIISRYYEELKKSNGDKEKSISVTFKEMVPACFLTSLTTFVGFSSLVSAKIPVIKKMGFYTGLAVLIAFIVVIVFMPFILKITKVRGGTKGSRLLDRYLKWNSKIVLKHPKVVIGIFLITFVTSAFFTAFLKKNSFMLEELPKNNAIYRSIKMAEDSIGGVLSLSIFVRSKSSQIRCKENKDCPENYFCRKRDIAISMLHKIEKSVSKIAGKNFLSAPFTEILSDYPVKNGVCISSIINKKLLAFLDEIIAKIKNEKSFNDTVTNFASITIVLKDLSSALSGKKLNFSTCSEKFISQLLLPLKTDAKNFLNKFLAPTKTHLTLYLRDTGIKKLKSLRLFIEKLIHSSGLENRYEFYLTGSSFLAMSSIEYMIEDMVKSIVLAFVVIVILMGILFKSVRIGLISMIPNIYPLIFTMGFMGFYGINLRIATSIIFSISLGIAVDDTIHFIKRFKSEFFKGNNIDNAISITLQNTGKAMILTSFVLVIGFFIDIKSEFIAIKQFSILSSITIVQALLADLFLLPSLIKVFFKQFKFNTQKEVK